MNLVEVFFAIITRQAIRRESFASVAALVAAIRRFVVGWNERSQPFVWVKDAGDSMVKAISKRTSGPQTLEWRRDTTIRQVGDGSIRAVLEVMPVLQVGCLAAVGEPDAKAQVIVGELAGRIDPVAEQDNLAQATHHTARLRSRPLRFVAESPAQDGAKSGAV
jgi:hypothetical protein